MVGMIETQILTVLVFLGLGAIMFNIFLLFLFPFGKLAFRRFKRKAVGHSFSLIVPAWNEGKVLERTIKRFLETDYDTAKKELIIVNDASSDDTGKIAASYASKIIDAETGKIIRKRISRGAKKERGQKNNACKNITLVNRKKGGMGKSFVSNDGIKHAKGDILAFIDADIQVPPHFFRIADIHFSDPAVSALAGKIMLAERANFVNGFIDFEFAVAQGIYRRAFNVLGMHYIVPGGCAFFRRSVIKKVNGYSHGTLAEDTDLTWKVLTGTNTKVHYDPRIVTLADEPTTIEGLWNQRVRWARGNMQVTLKHRDKIGKRRYGRAMTFCYPFWLITMILPITFILSSIGIFLTQLLHIDVAGTPHLRFVFVVAFFVVWILGTVLGGKRSWFEGLISPGIVLLIGLFSLIFWETGIPGLMVFLGLWQYADMASLVYSAWLFISIPGIYLSLLVSRKSQRLGNFLALGIFGYWMLLLTSAFDGYLKQLRRKENVWLKTRH